VAALSICWQASKSLSEASCIEGAACGFYGGFLQFCRGVTSAICSAPGLLKVLSARLVQPEEQDSMRSVSWTALRCCSAGCVFGFIYVFEAVGDPWNGVFAFEGSETWEEFGH
jgi:hypothetical protein